MSKSKYYQQLIISISPYKISKFLTFSVLGFTFVNIAGVCLQYVFNFRKFDRLIALLNVGDDSSIPTWYSSFSLLLAAFLLMLIALAKGRKKDYFFRHWSILALIFAAIAIDEVVMIHENIGDLLGLSFNNSWFYYSWVALAIPIIIIVIFSYWKFLLHLPSSIKYLFLTAGGLFVLGGLGMEMLSAHHDNYYGTNNLTYNSIMIAEEFLEMIAIVIFIHGLLSYIQLYLTKIQITFK